MVKQVTASEKKNDNNKTKQETLDKRNDFVNLRQSLPTAKFHCQRHHFIQDICFLHFSLWINSLRTLLSYGSVYSSYFHSMICATL